MLEVTVVPAACRRCGLPGTQSPACPRCSMPQVSDTPAVADVLPPGVRAATTGRRAAVLAVDLVPVLVLVVADVLGGPGLRWPVLALLAVYLVVAGAVWAATGRTPGGRLLGLRTVDAETGEPVRARRLLRRLARRRRAGLLVADLRTGPDPLELPVPATADLEERKRSARGDHAGSATPGERALLAYAGPRSAGRTRVAGGRTTLGLLLGNGQRHEVTSTLLLGRNPVDTAGEGAVLAPWPDMARRLARTHLRAQKSGSLLWVTDLGTASGTTLVGPDGLRRTLAPGVPAVAVVGTTIECGGRTARVVQGG